MTYTDLDVAPPDTASRLRAAARRARSPLSRFVMLRWVPLTAALLSLVLSVVAIYTATQEPSVTMLMPGQVRIAQGHSTGGAYLYLQPAFGNTAQNNRVEVIRDMALHVSGPAAADFRWSQQLRFVTDAATGELTYEYVADAVPLVVSPSNAASPLGLFEAPHGWFFAAGTYQFTLSADRVVAGSALSATFSVTLTADNVAFLDQPGPDKFLEFPIR